MDLKSLEFVRVELADGIAELRLCRPKAMNALNQQVLGELKSALESLAKLADLRVLVVTGDGDRAFVAGADIAEMTKMTPAEAKSFSQLGHTVFDMVENFPVPVLGAVNGYALGGGCELALACDILYASDRAKFGQPEVKLGLIPGFGGAVRLPRKIGRAAASEWILTGEVLSAQQAQEAGLVREVVPPADLMTRVREVARLIAARAPLAVRAAKKAINEGLKMSEAEAMRLEQDTFASLFASEDMREGTAAFLDKREAKFAGR